MPKSSNLHKPEILYRDDQILVVDKPAGLLSIPDRYEPDKPNLQQWLEKDLGKLWVLHRLDRDTSGLIIFARTEEAHRNLSLQFEKRQVEKYYYALVAGRIPDDQGEIDRPIAQHPAVAGKMTVHHKGKPSLTLYKVLARFQGFTYVEADLKTGRTHQIRVHFQALGFPLAVDPLYNNGKHLFLSSIKRKGFSLGKDQDERPLLSRTPLHAHRLVIHHPLTGALMEFNSPLPKDFSAVLKQLEKWGR